MQNQHRTNRREFIKDTGIIAAAGALASVTVPRVHAAEDNTIQVALIGCGGRGTGAACQAIAVNKGPVKLVAMADVFPDRLESSIKNIQAKAENSNLAAAVDVPKERQFIGFDAYKKAMDCLRPGDIALFATPPAFRWPHFTYAIEKGLNVFMEKPVTVDGPTSIRMLKLADAASAKNLKVAVGLMSRHHRSLQQLAERLHNGELGEIITLRGYRMHGPVGSFASPPKPNNISELLYQVQRFHSFIWASGGCFSDFYIHGIDNCCWMKNAWPVEAQALGGRHFRGDSIDQNFDAYAVEYTFADGTKFFYDGRCMPGCEQIYHTFAHGTKGSAIISKTGDCGGLSCIFSGQSPTRDGKLWEAQVDAAEQSPYQNEWNDFVEAIRNDKPYNEARRGVEASLVTSMGRMAAHTGKIITYEDMLNCKHEMAPDLDKFTFDSPAPLQAGPDGKYPVPQPGIITDREY
jgi:predicted dehydrogenase